MDFSPSGIRQLGRRARKSTSQSHAAWQEGKRCNLSDTQLGLNYIYYLYLHYMDEWREAYDFEAVVVAIVLWSHGKILSFSQIF